MIGNSTPAQFEEFLRECERGSNPYVSLPRLELERLLTENHHPEGDSAVWAAAVHEGLAFPIPAVTGAAMRKGSERAAVVEAVAALGDYQYDWIAPCPRAVAEWVPRRVVEILRTAAPLRPSLGWWPTMDIRGEWSRGRLAELLAIAQQPPDPIRRPIDAAEQGLDPRVNIPSEWADATASQREACVRIALQEGRRFNVRLDASEPSLRQYFAHKLCESPRTAGLALQRDVLVADGVPLNVIQELNLGAAVARAQDWTDRCVKVLRSRASLPPRAVWIREGAFFCDIRGCTKVDPNWRWSCGGEHPALVLDVDHLSAEALSLEASKDVRDLGVAVDFSLRIRRRIERQWDGSGWTPTAVGLARLNALN